MLDSLLSLWLDLNISETKKNWDQVLFKNNISSIEEIIGDEFWVNWKSALVMDLKSSAFLWGDNIDEKIPMASLTKLMTALIIIEENKLDEKVKISENAVYTQWAKIYMIPWEVFTVWDLLKWLLIRSWNDTAVALAEHNSWSVEKFVSKMNKRARELGLKNTNFKNPTWLDEENHYSSAKDLAHLSLFLLKNKLIKDLAKTKFEKIKSNSWRSVEFYSTNKLLWNWIVGLKTWTTEKAWQCLITVINKDWKELLFVLLWSTNRFDTTESLIDFVMWKI